VSGYVVSDEIVATSLKMDQLATYFEEKNETISFDKVRSSQFK
jgi:hypothetical protein